MGKIIFVTGTDTGVGKTLVTALLLEHLRSSGVRALGMKPFCSGGRGDVEVIQAVQQGELSNDEANPFYFEEPIAPMVAARKAGRTIPLEVALERIRAVASKCDCLLVEGCGGLLVPLGDGYAVIDLVARLPAEIIVVSRNRLGTLNHTLLTVAAIKSATKTPIKVVLSDTKESDVSCVTNGKILAELLSPISVIRLSLLGKNAVGWEAIQRNAKKIKKTLARIADAANLCLVL